MKKIIFGVLLLLQTLVYAQSVKQVIFRSGQAINDKIPAGVTFLTIEAWGAGGGGSFSGGGQGGGYFKCTVPVRPNDDIELSVGTGGAGGTAFGNNGGSTTLVIKRSLSAPPYSLGIYEFTAQGGTGSNNGVAAGGYITGNYSLSSPMNFTFIGSVGGNGTATSVPALAVRSDNIVLGTSIGGNGGDGANSVNTKGIGGNETMLLKVNSPFLYYGILGVPFRNKTNPLPGLVPGGGGGGATAFDQNNSGAIGGGGLLILSFTN